MKKETKAISMVLIIAMVSIIVALSGCTEEKANKIIVGTSADFPPFEYMEGDEIVGFDVEMITDILTS